MIISIRQFTRTQEEIRAKRAEYSYPESVPPPDDLAYDLGWSELLDDDERSLVPPSQHWQNYIHHTMMYKDKFSRHHGEDHEADWNDHYVTGVVDALAWLFSISEQAHNRNKGINPVNVDCGESTTLSQFLRSYGREIRDGVWNFDPCEFTSETREKLIVTIDNGEGRKIDIKFQNCASDGWETRVRYNEDLYHRYRGDPMEIDFSPQQIDVRRNFHPPSRSGIFISIFIGYGAHITISEHKYDHRTDDYTIVVEYVSGVYSTTYDPDTEGIIERLGVE